MSQTSSTRYVPMIREVSIDNFKGIKHCKIKDLAKVNLFIGKNSCGKSAIMEAMYFTGKEFLGANLPQCLQRRANRGNWSARELWYGYDMSSDVNVKLTFSEQDQIGMRIRYGPEEDRVQIYLGSNTLGFGEREELICTYHKTGFSLSTGRSRINFLSSHPRQVMEYFNRSVLIDPAIKIEVRQIEGNYLNQLKLSEEDSLDLAKRTSEIYETKPNWEFLPHPDYSPNDPSRFAILEGNRRMFFDNFGDGLHYGLAVLAAAKTRSDAALFIEEIESHQHPEAIKNLVSNVISIAEMNSLQLFITTHNRFVWNCLEKEFETDEERQNSLRVYRVVRDKNTGSVECIPQTRENANEWWSALDKELYG